MLSLEIDKVFPLAKARQTALIQEAAAARLVHQPAQGNARRRTSLRSLWHWVNRLSWAVTAYQPEQRPRVEA